MDNWIVLNKIKNGSITYSVGDEVVIFRRKGKYPSHVKDNIIYTIQSVENDFIIIRMSGLDGTGTFLTIDGSGDVIKGTVGAAGVTGSVS